jgi:hypothetical protein
MPGVKNRAGAHEKYVDAALQPMAQFFVNAAFAPGLIGIHEQSPEFFAAIEAETAPVTHGLP